MSDPYVYDAATFLTQFRTDFPEFADPTIYSDAMINKWSGVADKRLTVRRWGDLLLEGLQFFTAHFVAVQSMNVAAAAIPGATPGTGTQVIGNQSVGGVSVNLDTQASIENNGGFWNETSYGRTYLRLARLVGTGGAFV